MIELLAQQINEMDVDLCRKFNGLEKEIITNT
jgi:hypothetical protein